MSKWNKITTRDFIRIQEVIHLETNPVVRMAKVLEIATKHKYNDLMQLPMYKLRELAKKTSGLLTPLQVMLGTDSNSKVDVLSLSQMFIK